MYKLAVFDLDGTLLNSKYEISNDNLEAIAKLRDNGIKVTIATGRANELVKKYVNILDIQENIITCNGTVIGHPYKDDCLYQDIVPKDQVKKILEMCVLYKHQYLVYTAKVIIAKKTDKDLFLAEKDAVFSEYEMPNFIITDDIDYIVNDFDVNKILIIERDEELYQELCKRIIGYNGVSHTQSNQSYLDIGPLNNSKGNAVKIICSHLGIHLEEVIAFGDQYNDISMLDVVGLSIVMNNASDEVKKHGDYVTLTNDESGVAYAINNIIMEKNSKN